MFVAVVAVVRPIIMSVASHPSVKKLVIELLERYVASTDNSIDDVILELVKENIFVEQSEG